MGGRRRWECGRRREDRVGMGSSHLLVGPPFIREGELCVEMVAGKQVGVIDDFPFRNSSL